MKKLNLNTIQTRTI